MQRADIADELFVPLEHAEWHEGRLRVPRGQRAAARTRITGVRFVAADPSGDNREPERQTQTDLHRLLSSLVDLRGEAGGDRLRLSGETLCTTPRRAREPRLRFGLATSDEPLDEPCVARRTYRDLRRAISRAGYVVETPTERYAADAGLLGLRDWTDQLRLRRRRARAPWLLLPLLLALALLFPPSCSPAEAAFFGAPIEARSFLLLVDRSGSMEQHFPALRRETRRVLDALQAAGDCAVDIVAFHGQAASVLGAITPLDDEVRARLELWLDGLDTAGGTRLTAGLAVAAREIAAHGEPTTLVILTDAEDSTIPELLALGDELRGWFKDVEVHAHALTPAHFPAPAAAGTPPDLQSTAPLTTGTPRNPAEQRLADLAERLGGRFGPSRLRK